MEKQRVRILTAVVLVAVIGAALGVAGLVRIDSNVGQDLGGLGAILFFLAAIHAGKKAKDRRK